MATTTLQVARRELAQYLGYGDIVGKDQLAWATTTNITTTTVIISTELRDAGFDDLAAVAASGDDSLEGLFAYLPAGTGINIQATKKVDTYDASLGSVDVLGIALAAESGTVDFELHRYHPARLKNALNGGARIAYPALHAPRTVSLFTAQHQVRYDVPATIVGPPDRIYLDKGIFSSFANNILSNPALEDFTSGVPDDWDATTLDTAEEEVSDTPFNYMILEGSSSVRCTSQSGNVGTLLQTVSSPGTHSGQRINLMVWVYCRTANVVSTQITLVSTDHLGTAGDAGLHQGTGWELLTHFEDSLVTLSTLKLGISIVSTATDNTEFYVGKAICVVGPGQEPETDWEELYNWEYRDDLQGTTVRQQVVFDDHFPDNYLLWFEGKGYLTTVSAESDTFEIGAPQTDLLYAYAANELFRGLARDGLGNMERLQEQRGLARNDIDNYGSHAMPTPRLPMSIPS